MTKAFHEYRDMNKSLIITKKKHIYNNKYNYIIYMFNIYNTEDCLRDLRFFLNNLLGPPV